ncbi:MAG TPA: universal stress protein [Streptosporangiaceae bacterium]|nr:universal stress protein [Streptosporangiaceae bacterium]
MDRDLSEQRIVAGMHRSAASLAALRWAVREASLRDARLDVVHAWEDRAKIMAPYAAYAALAGYDIEDRDEAAAELREAAWAVLGGPLPDTVTLKVVEGPAARVLIEQATGADLLVLGGGSDPGRGSAGAVAQACLRHAPCPVTVVCGDVAAQPLPPLSRAVGHGRPVRTHGRPVRTPSG